MIKTQKILIIGSSGFIGGHLLTFFRSLGQSVFGLTHKGPAYSLANETEINNFTSLDAVFQHHQFDVCIFAGGSSNVADSFSNPLVDFHKNVQNLVELLDVIRRFNPTCKFIHLSSAAVYGNVQSIPIKESDALNPISAYGHHKQISEQICKEYHMLYNIPTINLRLFSIYGEGLKRQLFWDLHNKINQSENQGNISLFGSQLDSRDFLYVGDLVRAIDHIISNFNFDGKAVNIASGKETTIHEASRIFTDIYSSQPLKLDFNQEYIPGYPSKWCANVDQLIHTGFVFKFDLFDGLKNYVRWIRSTH